jgi:type I restriction enzyme, S subunit
MVDLRPDQLATVQSILRAVIPNHEVWAFGSRAKWTARDSSDLDLAIITDRSLPIAVLGRLHRAFEESFLSFKVDVVDWSQITEEFRSVIRKQHVVIQEPTQSETSPAESRGWKSLPLEECVETIIDYRGKTPHKVPAGIPLITAKIIKDGRIDKPTEFIAPESYVEWMRRGLPQSGDVLLTMEAPLGEVAQLDDRKVALAQRLVALRGKPGLLDNTFLKFLLRSSQAQHQLKAHATGTTVLGIRQSELRKINLMVPPLAEQHAIAHVLGSLDNKIESNRRTNETLEALARAMFQKTLEQRGRQKGWRSEKLGDIVELAYGKALKEEDRRLGQVPVFGSNGQVGWHDEALVKGPGIVVGRKGNPGIVTWSQTDFFPIDTTFYVVPKSECRSMYFLYYALRDQNLPSLGADSAVPGLNRNMAYLSEQIVPPPAVLEELDVVAAPVYARIHANDDESRTLAALRDMLLPKLLTGQLRLPAGQFSEAPL